MAPRFGLPVLLIVAACGHAEGVPSNLRSMLEDGSLELYSIDPTRHRPDEPVKARPTLQGYTVLGHFPLSDRERAAVIDALMDGLDEGGRPALCFNPRHALEARHGEHTLTVTICYECAQVSFQQGPREDWATIGSSRQSVLDGVLHRHGVALAPRGH